MGVDLVGRAKPYIPLDGLVPAHRSNQVSCVDWVLQGRDDQWGPTCVTHLVQYLTVRVQIADSFNTHAFLALALRNVLILLALGDAVHLRSHLALSVERIDEQIIPQLEQVVHKVRFQALSLSMVELPISVHHTHLPVADVRVAKHLLGRDRGRELLRPRELAVTVKLSKVQVASVLAAVHVHKVAVAVTCAIMPLSCVLCHLVGLDLDTVTVAHSDQLSSKLFIDLADVVNDQRLDSFLVKSLQRVRRLSTSLI